MPIIEPGNLSLRQLKGLHVWHGDLSSCSQRVRITLAEKGLEWESHVIDIPNMEHATPEYQAINPKGLVPAFIDNGVLLIESCDIIQYIDKKYPEPPLHPSDAAVQAELKAWLDDADRAQGDLKTLSHEFLFRNRRAMSPEDLEKFCTNHQNEELVAFMREYQSSDMLNRDKLDDAVTCTDEGFRRLDERLAESDWILGDTLTLADIAWMPNIHRMDLMGWPFDRYTNLLGWFERVKARPSYQIGLVNWEPTPVRGTFAAYSKQRAATATHVINFGSLAAGV